MEDTLILETGRNAQLNAETELKPEQELALTLLLPMVVLIVLGRLLKRDLADQKEIVQVCSYYLNIIDNSRRDNNNYICTLLHYIYLIISGFAKKSVSKQFAI